MANEQHVARLRSGVTAWNAWRATTSEYPDLSQLNLTGVDPSDALQIESIRTEMIQTGLTLTGEDLSGANLSRADLRGATLIGTDLSGADLSGANLSGATLFGADFTGATLTRARLRRADLSGARLTDANLYSADLAHSSLVHAYVGGADLRESTLAQARLTGVVLHSANLTHTNLRGVDLTDANLTNAIIADSYLEGAALVRTNLEGATLNGCHVYGISVWDVRLAGAQQTGLHIQIAGVGSKITVDDLEVAQFIYLLLKNAKLRNVIETVTSKAVLLLGRFTPERKAVLDALHAELRRRNYLPILFDFDRPSSRDTTETILTLAGMARFIIADLTDAASVQQELTAVVRALPSVPVQPIVLKGQHEWSMFRDLQRHGATLTPYVYDSLDALLDALPDYVISPADLEAQRRRRELAELYAEADARRRS